MVGKDTKDTTLIQGFYVEGATAERLLTMLLPYSWMSGEMVMALGLQKSTAWSYMAHCGGMRGAC